MRPGDAAGPPSTSGDPEIPGGDRGSVALALQDQLGLKLESRKQPVEVLVIDRMDRTPTEN